MNPKPVTTIGFFIDSLTVNFSFQNKNLHFDWLINTKYLVGLAFLMIFEIAGYIT